MDNIIIDTPVWIGYHWKNDQWSVPSNNIITAFLAGQIKNVHVTSFVIVETVNFLLRKERQDMARACLDALQSERIVVHHVDASMFAHLVMLVKKYQGLSLTDASLIYLGLEQNIKSIFSFDRIFDAIPGITRLSDFAE